MLFFFFFSLLLSVCLLHVIQNCLIVCRIPLCYFFQPLQSYQIRRSYFNLFLRTYQIFNFIPYFH